MLYRIRIEKKVEREEVAKVTGTNKDDSASSGPRSALQQRFTRTIHVPVDQERSTNTAMVQESK